MIINFIWREKKHLTAGDWQTNGPLYKHKYIATSVLGPTNFLFLSKGAFVWDIPEQEFIPEYIPEYIPAILLLGVE